MNIDENILMKIGLQKRNGEITETWNDLVQTYADGFFVNGEAYRVWVKNKVKRKNKKEANVIFEGSSREEKQETKNYKETIEINKDGSQSSDILLEMSKEQSKDVDFLLQAHGYDTQAWELVSARNNIWNVYSKVDGVQTLYSSKIVVKPLVKQFDITDVKDIFVEMLKNYERPQRETFNAVNSGKLLEVSIADLHLGKLAWDGDSGDTYNKDIAKRRFFEVIDDAIYKTKTYDFEKIVFVWSNDFFHYDTLNVTTTGGTRQDTDMKIAEMYQMGIEMLVSGIDKLVDFYKCPLETFYVGSNHDQMLSYFATQNLAAWYRNDSNVIVNTDPKIRKYIEFGKCLIQFSHGHAEGKRIGQVMPVEEAEAWGRTLYREVHAGHFHSERTKTEDNGIIVRYLGSPAGTDTWHYGKGYVGAIKKGQSFVWDKEKGLELAIYSTVSK